MNFMRSNKIMHYLLRNSSSQIRCSSADPVYIGVYDGKSQPRLPILQ